MLTFRKLFQLKSEKKARKMLRLIIEIFWQSHFKWIDFFSVCYVFSPLQKMKKKTIVTSSAQCTLAVLPADSINFNFRHSITVTSMLSNRISHIKSFYFSNTSHFGVVTCSFSPPKNITTQIYARKW